MTLLIYIRCHLMLYIFSIYVKSCTIDERTIYVMHADKVEVKIERKTKFIEEVAEKKGTRKEEYRKEHESEQTIV